MNTKRIPLLLVVMVLVCAGLAYFVATFRPLAPNEKFGNTAPTKIAAVSTMLPTAAKPTATATRVPTGTTPPTVTATETAISLQVADLFRQPPTITPLPTETPSPSMTPTLLPLSTEHVVETQTSVLALATFEAISRRVNETATPFAADADPTIQKTTNFLFVGTDTRTADPHWEPNTDVMMVLFLDTANQRAALLSLPRDLVVAIPGHEAFRLNYVYHYGWDKGGADQGMADLKSVLKNEFDIRIDHWALIDFDGLSKIVDTLGGIDVQVPCPLQDTIDQQPFTIPAGLVQMDYLTAKRYVQSRYSTSDTSRNFRQQRVVWAMAKKALATNAPDRLPLLYAQLKDSVATDMTLLDLVGLVPSVYQLDLQNHPERLHAEVLEPPAVYPWISPSGAWLFMPNYGEIQKTIASVFDAPQVAGATASSAECPAVDATPEPTDRPTPGAASNGATTPAPENGTVTPLPTDSAATLTPTEGTTGAPAPASMTPTLAPTAGATAASPTEAASTTPAPTEAATVAPTASESPAATAAPPGSPVTAPAPTDQPKRTQTPTATG